MQSTGGRRGVPLTAALRRLLPLMGAAAGGAMVWLAFPAWDLWPLAVVGPAILYVLTAARTPGRGAALGGTFGLAFMLPLLSWSGVFVGDLPWVALATAEAAFFAALGAGAALISRLRGAPLWSALLWVAMEAARSRWPFGGLPWGRLAFSQADSALAHLAALGGAPLVSFAVTLTGALLGSAVLQHRAAKSDLPGSPRRARWPRALVVALVPWAVALPMWATAEDPTTRPGVRAVEVAVIQGNVPRAGLDFNAQRRAVLDNHVQATLELAAQVRAGDRDAPQLVIWPENSSDIDPLTNADAAAQIDRAARAVGVPILIGAVLDGPGRYLTNAGIIWDPITGPGDRYAKRHPVPFGEYMPARSFFRLFSDKVDLLRRDFIAGDEPGLLDVAGVRLGDVICFEVAYDGLVADVVRGGAELLVVQTNNATFGFTDESPQQLAMSRLRAIEFNRTVVVAATSGLSAIVLSDGSVLAGSQLFTPWTFADLIPVGGGTTVATRLGSLPELAMTAAAVAALLYAVVLHRRPAVANPPPSTREEVPVES